MNWDDSEIFPMSNGQWETLDRHEAITYGEEEAKNLSKKWFPLNNTLYSSPSSKRFTLAICVPEIGRNVHKLFARKFPVYIYIPALFLVLVTSLSLYHDNFRAFSKIHIFLLIFLGYSSFEYQYFVKPYARLRDHALFFYWARSEKNPLLKIFMLLAVTSGLAQLVSLFFISDVEILVSRFGLHYQKANDGEWWRYLVGPFIHKDFIHWLTNIALLTIASTLVGPLSRFSLIFYFLLILILSSFAAQFSLVGVSPEGFVGISGGVFGILGWAIGNSYRDRERLPSGYCLHLLVFSCANIALPFALNTNSSSVSHLTGLAMGAFFGVIGLARKK
ncbi:MAG: rhomboid family intramembrane serine protease [Oceanicoccus sp.]